MTRQTALEILTKYLTDERLIKHSFATEATMKALAVYFGEDEEMWGTTGLLHDADYELSKGHPDQHGKLLFEKEPNMFPTEIEQAIKAHNHAYTGIKPQSSMDWAIACCDELTALINAITLAQKEKKIKNLTLDFVMKKLHQKDFARGASRKDLFLCEEKLGIPVIEFVAVALSAMQGISETLGL